MARATDDLRGDLPTTDTRSVDLALAFDAETLVDDLLALSEWLRDRRRDACARS